MVRKKILMLILSIVSGIITIFLLSSIYIFFLDKVIPSKNDILLSFILLGLAVLLSYITGVIIVFLCFYRKSFAEKVFLLCASITVTIILYSNLPHIYMFLGSILGYQLIDILTAIIAVIIIPGIPIYGSRIDRKVPA